MVLTWTYHSRHLQRLAVLVYVPGGISTTHLSLIKVPRAQQCRYLALFLRAQRKQ